MFQEKYHGGREKPVRWKRSRLASLFPFITTRKLMMAPKDDRRQTLRAGPKGDLDWTLRLAQLTTSSTESRQLVSVASINVPLPLPVAYHSFGG